MCDRCAELEERVAWLESELGLREAADIAERLRRAFMRTDAPDAKARGCARFIGVLYAAKGRVVTYEQILEAIPPHDGGSDERSSNLLPVLASRSRRLLGDGVRNVRSVGYRLTPDAMAQVDGIIQTPTATRP